MTEESFTSGVTPDVTCNFFSEKGWSREQVPIPAEMELTIYVNRQEVVTVLCTPAKLNQLVIGFLYSGGIISGLQDIAMLRVCAEEPIADVRLRDGLAYQEPAGRTLTSGCGRGVSFKKDFKKVSSSLTVTPEDVLALMKQLYEQQNLFQRGGGIHCSALCDRSQILVLAEDIGRHNTLDKIVGECLMRKIPTQDCILLTTGRISSEMLAKAARMQAPIVVSRGSPTDRAVALGNELGVTVIGYARGNRLSVFSCEERVPAAGVTTGR